MRKIMTLALIGGSLALAACNTPPVMSRRGFSLSSPLPTEGWRECWRGASSSQKKHPSVSLRLPPPPEEEERA
jgi:hypothetical protein